MDLTPIFISPKIYTLMAPSLYDKLRTYHLIDQTIWPGTRFISHPRYGKSRIWNLTTPSYTMGPSLIGVHACTFAEATDSRAEELRRIASRTGKRVGLYWSGGIDSNVALTSIIKNFTKAELENVVIFMNNSSYQESPGVYHDVIMRYKLTTINVSIIDKQELTDLTASYILVDGEPGDKLWVGGIAVKYEQVNGVGSLQRSIRLAKDSVVDFFSGVLGTEYSLEYYEDVMRNINESGAHVETVSQYIRWIGFNYHWSGHVIMRYAASTTIGTNESYSRYVTEYFPWFNGQQYQHWSLTAALDPRSDTIAHLGEYKGEAKQYINDIFDCPFALRFKTKIQSASRGDQVYNGSVLAVFNSGETLNTTSALSDIARFIDVHCLVS